MKIFTKRNALVGYLVLNARKRAVEKRIRRRRRSGLKVAAYVGLGLISAGILAAVLAVAVKRRSRDLTETDTTEGENELEFVGEYVTAPGPIPGT